jgi:hypothetical protein
MQRREFISLLSVAALIPLAAHAQKRTHKTHWRGRHSCQRRSRSGQPQRGEDHASGAAMIITYFTVCPTAKFYDMDNATRGVLDIIKYQYGGIVMVQKLAYWTATLKEEITDQTDLDNMCMVLERHDVIKEINKKRR